ncbi:MAG: septal ring lytic transglycosylase RlpA family protein [Candidatus Buchananbacteria bacterium]
MKKIQITKFFKITIGLSLLLGAGFVLAQTSTSTLSLVLDNNSLAADHDFNLFNDHLQLKVLANTFSQNVNLTIKQLADSEVFLPTDKKLISEIYQINLTQDQFINLPINLTINCQTSGDFTDGVYFLQAGDWLPVEKFSRQGGNKYSISLDTLPATVAIFELPSASYNFVKDQFKTQQEVKAGSFKIWLPAKGAATDIAVNINKVSDPATNTEQLVSPIFSYEAMGLNEARLAKYPLTVWFDYFVDNYYGKEIKYFSTTTQAWVPLRSSNDPANHKVAAKISLASATLGVFNKLATEEGVASWYAYKGCNCAASRTYAKGTKLKVTNLTNNKSVIVKINDVGPEIWTGRLVDLDKVAFKKLAATTQGLISVRVEKVK